MTELEFTGGARIGMFKASWPFAKLKISNDRMILTASLIGQLEFMPNDIISIESYGVIPVIGRGIKINHRVSAYKDKVIFWTFGDPDKVIKRIGETGFLENRSLPSSGNIKEIELRQNQGGFPIRTPFAVGVVVIWNALFAVDFVSFFMGDFEGVPVGNGAMMALGLVFMSCALTLFSKGFRKKVLKDGCGINDIKLILLALMLLSGLMIFGIFSFPK